MKIDREKNVIVCGGKEYPPTQHNAEIYGEWKFTEDEERRKVLEMKLSKIKSK